ncbi:MAG: three-Cys-motif partner protein TcmP [Terriglobia bacterium]
MKNQREFDEIGYWSEVKLEILKKYASAYSTLLAARRQPSFHHVYIDAFAGAGIHLSKTTGEFVPGSPLNALAVQPPFREYHLIDIDAQRIGRLRKLIGGQTNVHLYKGDCNQILLQEIFPLVQFRDYRRGLCILDPYGLHLDWKAMWTAGQMKTIDLFLNFPVADINRNVLWHNPDCVSESQIVRMNSYWGDESWRNVAYRTDMNLFGQPEKQPNEVVAEAFRRRLKEEAGFDKVPDPLPMRNSKGAIVYYLFFASQKDAAESIVQDIFEKYRKRGEK